MPRKPCLFDEKNVKDSYLNVQSLTGKACAEGEFWKAENAKEFGMI